MQTYGTEITFRDLWYQKTDVFLKILSNREYMIIILELKSTEWIAVDLLYTYNYRYCYDKYVTACHLKKQEKHLPERTFYS